MIYWTYILTVVYIGGTYLNILTDKYSAKKRTAVNFYIKSILTFDTWTKEDYFFGLRLAASYNLGSVEFEKNSSKFDPLANKNVYINLPKKYWDKLFDSNSPEEQEAVYQKAVWEIKTYYDISSSWVGGYGKCMAFSLVGTGFSIFLFIALIAMNKKVKRIIIADINQIKGGVILLRISMKKIIKKLNIYNV